MKEKDAVACMRRHQPFALAPIRCPAIHPVSAPLSIELSATL